MFKITEKFDKKVENQSKIIVKPERVFQGGHAYNINSIAFNMDGDNMLSSDDLRINLWNIAVKDEAMNIVDLKPENMDELSEVITSIDLNPTNSHEFVFSSSKGIIRVGDLRSAALCDKSTKSFSDPNYSVTGFFQELVTSISDIKYSPCGRMIASRDYLSVKIWDTRYEDGPINTIKFHDHLLEKLCDLYEKDAMFDKFALSWSHDSSQILTGSYSNNFYICDSFTKSKVTLTANKLESDNSKSLQMEKKVLNLAWHPKKNLIAVGANDFGYLYQMNQNLS